MKRKIPIKQLLRWQLAQAEAAAPSAPRARRLLEAARPWWETQPEQFRDLADQLDRVKIAHGDAMAKLKATSAGHPVPVLIIHRAKNVETSARVISLNVRDGTLRPVSYTHLDVYKRQILIRSQTLYPIELRMPATSVQLRAQGVQHDAGHVKILP